MLVKLTPYRQRLANAVQRVVVGRNGDVFPEIERIFNAFAQISENIWIATLFVNGACLFVKLCHLWSISSTFYERVFCTKVLFCQNPFAKTKTQLEKSCALHIRTKNAHVKRS